MTPRAGAAVLAALLALSACGGGQSGEPESGDKRYVAGAPGSEAYEAGKRRQAPRVEGEGLDGERLSLQEHRGKVVVLNYWASWCAPCRSEAPTLKQLSNEFKKDVQFLGVNIKDGKEAAKAFERRFGIDYPSFYDQPGKIALAFQAVVPPQAIPSTLVIDRKGGVAARVIGEVRHSQLKKLLTTAVNEGG